MCNSDHVVTRLAKWTAAIALSLGVVHAAGDPRNPKAQEAHEWAYDGEGGPDHWGELAPEFAECSHGLLQSPIDIVSRQASERFGGSPQFFYGASRLEVIHKEHTIEVDYEPGSFIQVGRNRYELLQFHFHAPSEHTVEGGAQFPVEMHLVHVSPTGSLAVVGVLIREGEENEALRAVWENLPTAGGETVHADGEIEVEAILPDDRRAYHYSGSLTTPPCSEGVRWMVLRTPVEMSSAQIQQFRDAIGAECCEANARPAQPLNDRLFGLDVF